MEADGASSARVLPSRLVLLGHPVAHSLSPRFHSAALRAAGLPVTYEALDTPPAALAVRLEALRREGAAGNVTIPHKEAVRVACGQVTALAERAGAVNTFWTEHGVLHGDNTDVAGFEASAHALLEGATSGRRVAILGAGGATRAVLTAIEGWPDASVVLYGRTRERAEALAASFPVVQQVAGSAESAVAGADLIVNASPVGLHDLELPVPLDALSAGASVLDLVYRQGETEWVRAARARGHRAADGKTMLLEQGARSFERWFGFSPDRDVMRAALD
jgi:shikimate dehydrogenase